MREMCRTQSPALAMGRFTPAGGFEGGAARSELRSSALRKFARELGSRPKRFASANAGLLLSIFVSCTPAIRASSVSKWRRREDLDPSRSDK